MGCGNMAPKHTVSQLKTLSNTSIYKLLGLSITRSTNNVFEVQSGSGEYSISYTTICTPACCGSTDLQITNIKLSRTDKDINNKLYLAVTLDILCLCISSGRVQILMAGKYKRAKVMKLLRAVVKSIKDIHVPSGHIFICHTPRATYNSRRETVYKQIAQVLNNE